MPQRPVRVLVSAFEPFGGMDHNPSVQTVEHLAEQAATGELLTQSDHHDVVLSTVILPVEFHRSGQMMRRAIDNLAPDLVLAVGLAAGTDAIRLERVGINLRDARIADNAGYQPDSEPVVPGADGALFTTLRVKAAEQRIRQADIAVQLSLSAGAYLCNDIFYTVLDHLKSRGLEIPAGFVHIPDLTDPNVGISVAAAAQALDIVIAESLMTGPDLALPSGSTH